MDLEALAKSLFATRWPDRDWRGRGTSRTYWRRMAKKLIALADGGE
jgi:hypothetical protein